MRARRDGATHVLHGADVETIEDGFVEGAWTGDFAAFDFDAAEALTGSGVRRRGDELVVAPPTHRLDRICWSVAEGELVASNSLAFLLRQLADRLAPSCPTYVRDLSSYIQGRRARTQILTVRGQAVHLLWGATLHVDRALRTRTEPHLLPAPWERYEDYRAWMGGTVNRLIANAADDRRRLRYRPVTTVSSGYDSPAAATLAREAGAAEAITIARARADTREFEDLDDSGAGVGEALGLRVVEFERDGYLTRDGFPEAEFLASGTGGNDVIFSGAEELVRGSVLFTGFHGDKAWCRKGTAARDGEMVRSDSSGSSLLEFRLRVGFIHLPAPCLGATRQAAITRISNSPDMAPWSIGGEYDRPIPRRMAECAGVPRELFGQVKKAVGQPFNAVPETPRAHARPLTALLSPASFDDVQRHLLCRQTPEARAVAARFHLVRRIDSPLPGRWQRALRRRGVLRGGVHLLDGHRYAYPLTDHDYLLQWALEKVGERYPAAQ